MYDFSNAISKQVKTVQLNLYENVIYHIGSFSANKISNNWKIIENYKI